MAPSQHDRKIVYRHVKNQSTNQPTICGDVAKTKVLISLIFVIVNLVWQSKTLFLAIENNRGIKHDFPFINICNVPREVLKSESEARDFQPSRGTLRMLMNDKIMFDRYYCINSAKYCENEENICALYFITSSHFLTRVRFSKTMHDSDTVQVLIILHVLCVAPGNKHN